MREADAALAAETVTLLSEQESRRFLEALDAPFQPNDRLQQVMDAANRLARG